MADRKKQKGKDDVASRRPMLPQRTKQITMAVLLQNMEAFKPMQDVLTAKHLEGYDQGMAVAWKLTCEFFEEHSTLPDREFLSAAVEEACDANPALLNEAEIADLSQFLEWAFDPTSFKKPVSEDRSYADWAIKNAKKFMEERLASKVKSLVQTKDSVLVDFPGQLMQIHAEAEKIASVSADTVSVSFPVGWEEEASIRLFPTNVPFIDHFMNGGQAPGEVYGLMGPYGSCKSTIAYMLGVEGCRHFHARSAMPDYDGVPEYSVIVSYEDRIKTMRNRCIGYAAEIPRRTMESLKKLTELSKDESLRDYEKAMYRDKIRRGEKILGEFNRQAHATDVMNKHLIFLDMTGYQRKGMGVGYLSEIARTINHELRNRGKGKCGLVVVDYVIAMCRRYMAAQNMGNDELRHLIAGAPLSAKSTIADCFDCPVWLLQQLSGDSNSLGETTLPDHTNSAECKSFGENLDFSFSIGKPNADNVAMFGCTKYRRAAKREETIIRVEGDFNRVRSVNDLYRVDPTQRRIMSLKDYNATHVDEPVKPAAQSADNQTNLLQ